MAAFLRFGDPGPMTGMAELCEFAPAAGIQVQLPFRWLRPGTIEFPLLADDCPTPNRGR